VKKVENMPAHFHFKRGIEEPNAEVFKWISESEFKDNLTLLKNTGVSGIKKVGNYFEIIDSKGQIHHSQFVLLCTGVMDVQPMIGESIEPIFPYANAQTVDYCLRCDGHHVLNKPTAVIGHDNSAAWVAIMLHERYGSQLSICLNGESANFESETRELLSLYEIKIIPEKIASVQGDPKLGRLDSIEFTSGESLNVSMCFVSLGMNVYSALAQSLGAELDQRGFVIANAQGLSSVEGFYVAGDVMAATKKQIYTAWDTAVNAADAINQKLRASKRSKKLQEYRSKVKPEV